MARDLISDEEWTFFERFILAVRAPDGHKPTNHRAVLNGIFWIAREVTAERIRDKVVAYWRKGMRMGGVPHYGYRVENGKLVVNKEHAEHVRRIFARFLETGSGTKLAREVGTHGSRIEKKYLYRLLSNRAYIGEAVHKGESYPGEHDAIIDQETWGRVYSILQESPRKRTAECCWPRSRSHEQQTPALRWKFLARS